MNINNYESYHECITKYATWLGSLYGLDLDDVKQDAYFGYLAAVRLYDDTKGASFETFLRRKVLGAILDKNKSRAWFGRHHMDVRPIELPEYMGAYELEFNEVEKILSPISKSEKLCTAIILKIVYGMESKEAAKFLGVSEGTISGNYHYGINKLRKYYGN